MKKGFAIPEILIIIGVMVAIAALALPNMIENHKKQVMVTKLQDTYNLVVNAVPAFLKEQKAESLYNTDAFNKKKTNDTKALANFVNDYFKVSLICTSETEGEVNACYGKEYNDLNGDVRAFGSDVCAILNTGATVCFGRQITADDFPALYIDVNGPKEPNIFGRDAFYLELNNAGQIAESFDNNVNDDSHFHNTANCATENSVYGSGCFNKIVKDGWVMDY